MILKNLKIFLRWDTWPKRKSLMHKTLSIFEKKISALYKKLKGKPSIRRKDIYLIKN
jgi:hypothetical protein